MPNELRSRSSRFSALRSSRWCCGLAVTALSLWAAGGSSVAASPGSSGEPASAPPAAGQLAPGEHPIGVRVGDSGGELFDKRNGETFFARGPSYLRLQTVDGVRTSTLFPPEIADPERTAADLAAMRQLGFNSVRVFIDLCVPQWSCIGNP